MSRTDHLKELQDELRPFFDQGIRKQKAYDQLNKDPRFDAIRLTKIPTIYKAFRKQARKAIRRERNRQLDRSEQLAYFRSILECDHKKEYGCLKLLYTQSRDGRFFVSFNRMSEIDSQRNFSLIDTFSNKKSQIKIQLDPVEEQDVHTFYPLTYDFVLLIVRTDYDDENTFSKITMSLLELDWTSKKSKKLHTITIEDQQRRFQLISIIVDEMDPTKFLLRLLHADNFLTLKFGDVSNNEIFFNEGILIDHNGFLWTRNSIAANKLYTLDMDDFVGRNTISTNITDLENGTQSLSFSFDLSQLPERFSRLNGAFTACFTPNRVFMAIQFKNTQNYGIVWSNSEAQEWSEMDFCTEEQILDIKFITDGGLLLVRTARKETELIRSVHHVQMTLYRIPLKKPEKLSNLAWFNLVRSKSQLPNVDPYEEAHKYLPYNSEIRAPFEE